MIRYSILRLLIFVVVLMILFATGLRSWGLLILSAVISLVVSFFALSGPRERFAEQVEHKVSQRRERAAAYRNADDDDLDEDE